MFVGTGGAYFLLLAQPNVVILPEADDDTYVVEAGREFRLTCYSDARATVQIFQDFDGVTLIAGEGEVWFFFARTVYM